MNVHFSHRFPCVIYCHGNCGSRVDASDCLDLLLPQSISVFAFDFSGSGLSDGGVRAVAFLTCTLQLCSCLFQFIPNFVWHLCAHFDVHICIDCSERREWSRLPQQHDASWTACVRVREQVRPFLWATMNRMTSWQSSSTCDLRVLCHVSDCGAGVTFTPKEIRPYFPTLQAADAAQHDHARYSPHKFTFSDLHGWWIQVHGSGYKYSRGCKGPVNRRYVCKTQEPTFRDWCELVMRTSLFTTMNARMYIWTCMHSWY